MDTPSGSAAQRSLPSYDLLLSNLPGMVYRCRNDEEWTTEYVSAGVKDVTGYSPDELVGDSPRKYSDLIHPDDRQRVYDEVQAAVGAGRRFELKYRVIDASGRERWVMEQGTAVHDEAGNVSALEGFVTDITESKAAEDKIQQLAFYDGLTRLPNRVLLLERLQHALATSERSGHMGALMFIDLDNFKTLNDTLGHDKGDLLLQQVAQRLAGAMRESDTVARLGGDEFVILLEELNPAPNVAAVQARHAGEKVLAVFTHPFPLGGHEHYGTSSIGITLFKGNGDGVDDILKRADLAMYQSKAAGRNAVRFFDPEMQAAVTRRATLEADLYRGVRERQFILYYQPQADIDGSITGVEALLRWQHPQRGLVAPSEFIPLAEEIGLIMQLGEWVLEAACVQLAAWAAAPETAELSMSVNVSARQFRHPQFVEQVMGALRRTGASPEKLKLELTESLLVEDVEDIIAKMTTLTEAGVRFSLDDFGTGYSSLAYLKRMPLDCLKIDQSFVRDVLTDANDAAIARTIVMLGQSLGLNVVAEGVETEAQHNFLADQGCQTYQGFLFNKPLPVDEFDSFIRAAPAHNFRPGAA